MLFEKTTYFSLLTDMLVMNDVLEEDTCGIISGIIIVYSMHLHSMASIFNRELYKRQETLKNATHQIGFVSIYFHLHLRTVTYPLSLVTVQKPTLF